MSDDNEVSEYEDAVMMDEFQKELILNQIFRNKEVMEEIKKAHPIIADKIKWSMRAKNLVESVQCKSIEDAEILLRDCRSG